MCWNSIQKAFFAPVQEQKTSKKTKASGNPSFPTTIVIPDINLIQSSPAPTGDLLCNITALPDVCWTSLLTLWRFLVSLRSLEMTNKFFVRVS